MDPELYAVRYAFDAAYLRMCEAETDDARMAELSNLLHHLYRLRELCRGRLSDFDLTERSTADLRAGRAASWARNADTHKLYATASQQPVYANVYTATYGALVWKPRSSLPLADDKEHKRHKDYETELEGKVVLATLRRAFDAMASLLGGAHEPVCGWAVACPRGPGMRPAWPRVEACPGALGRAQPAGRPASRSQQPRRASLDITRTHVRH